MFSPYELLRPTVDFLHVSDSCVTPLQISPSVWLTGEPRIWGPPLVALATIVAMGGRFLGSKLSARIAQIGVSILVPES